MGQDPGEEVWVTAARSVHGLFMDMVTDLLEGRLDVSNFEDNCRALLGEWGGAGKESLAPYGGRGSGPRWKHA